MAVGLPKDCFMLLTEIDGPPELVDARVEPVAEILRKAGSGDVVYSDDEEQRKKLQHLEKLWRLDLLDDYTGDLMLRALRTFVPPTTPDNSPLVSMMRSPSATSFKSRSWWKIEK